MLCSWENISVAYVLIPYFYNALIENVVLCTHKVLTNQPQRLCATNEGLQTRLWFSYNKCAENLETSVWDSSVMEDLFFLL